MEFVILVLFLILNSLKVTGANLYNVRKPRTLIYPITAPTRLQFIGGIGIPVEDLPFESITSGYVLKAEYFLPTKAEEFRPNYLKPQIITAEIERRSVNETRSATQFPNTHHHHYRHHAASTPAAAWIDIDANDSQSSNFDDNYKSKYKNASIYRWIIYRGIEMVLNSADLPGRTCVLRSICEHAAVPLHYDSGMLGEILNIVLTPSTSHDDFHNPSDSEYLQAEMFGHNGGACELKFSACKHSPVNQISTIFDLTNDFF